MANVSVCSTTIPSAATRHLLHGDIPKLERIDLTPGELLAGVEPQAGGDGAGRL
jgi:hypothetical protein